MRVYLEVRTPDLLRGRDLARYLDRKFKGYGLFIEPLRWADTDAPCFGLRGPPVGGKAVVKVRASTEPERLAGLRAHPLVESLMTEEEWQAWLNRPVDTSNLPEGWDEEPLGGVVASLPPFRFGTKAFIPAFVILVSPFLAIGWVIRKIRRIYLRDFS